LGKQIRTYFNSDRMNRTLALLAVLLVITMSLLSCTGYPDGPRISFQNQTDLLSTTWRVRQALRNGEIDITDQYEGEFFEFEDDGAFRKLEKGYTVSLPPYTQDTTFNAIAPGEWQFRSGGTEIELLYLIRTQDPYNPAVRYTEVFNELWTIQRLAEGELTLSDDSTVLRLEFFVP
jgi:hypothetical protein